MKAINKNTLFTILLSAFCSISFAQIPVAKSSKEAAMELKLVSYMKSGPLFQLNVNNKEKDDYFISIRDENNDVLFSESIKGENLSREYLVNLEGADFNDPGFKVSFEIRSKKLHKTTTYKINNRVLAEDIQISKV